MIKKQFAVAYRTSNRFDVHPSRHPVQVRIVESNSDEMAIRKVANWCPVPIEIVCTFDASRLGFLDSQIQDGHAPLSKDEYCYVLAKRQDIVEGNNRKSTFIAKCPEPASVTIDDDVLTKITKKVLKVLSLLEGTSLNKICAFRMAAKDIRNGKFQEAAGRIKSDLDKVCDKEQRETLTEFCRGFFRKT